MEAATAPIAFFGSTPGADTQVLGLKVAVLLSLCRPGALGVIFDYLPASAAILSALVMASVRLCFKAAIFMPPGSHLSGE